MNNKLVVLLALIGVFVIGTTTYLSINKPQQLRTNSSMLLSQWNSFKKAHSKKYSSPTEESYRMSVFSQNLEHISSSSTLGVTSLSDLTHEEFVSIYLTLKVDPNYNITPKPNPDRRIPACLSSYEASVNWVSEGAVTSVKNQGSCGSGWVFSTVAAIESRLIIQKKADLSIDLSEQQVLDCSYQFYNSGCGGGRVDNAFQWISNVGITTEAEYPYIASKQTCDKNVSNEIKILGYTGVRYHCVYNMLQTLTYQPISVAIDASTWQHYSGGIFTDCSWNNITLNHSALLVGYEDGIWLLKNSWGTSWGENGYIRIQDAKCGISYNAYYPQT